MCNYNHPYVHVSTMVREGPDYKPLMLQVTVSCLVWLLRAKAVV